MTPAARYAAAIEVLDLIHDGGSAEQVLTTWARQNRFAGSKDRAAIRDHVYDVLRQWHSVAGLGGGNNGRAWVLGLLRKQGLDPNTVFGAGGYGPEALSAEEEALPNVEMSPSGAADIPDWLWPMWSADLGDEAGPVAKVLQDRAPIGLRVNLRRGTVAAAQAVLAQDDIGTRVIDDVKTALEVVENPRRVAQGHAFQTGLVELQDIASQRAMLTVAPYVGESVLDYCAGGGGKALALADLTDAQVVAHDIAPQRMADIPTRAARAGVNITVTEAPQKQAFDLVLCDAPCSGSGTWRRTPHAKWQLTEARLKELGEMQRDVIESGAESVATGGMLAYATCSVLRCENDAIVADFLARHHGFTLVSQEQLLPCAEHDGFFLAMMRHV